MRFHFYRIKKRIVLGKNIRKILLIRLASIGDVVRATSVIQALSQQYPGVEIDFLTSSIALPILKGNPYLKKTYTPGDLTSLEDYEWVINLQRPDPPSIFLSNGSFSYEEILRFISGQVRCKLISGRHFNNDREIFFTNAHFCLTELEELFLTALLNWKRQDYPLPGIYLKTDSYRDQLMKKFGLHPGKPYLGIFIGSNSCGGYDQPFRTYSIGYVERLISSFESEFQVIMIGESKVKTSEELKRYREILKIHPGVIDLVDRTSLEELLYVMSLFSAFISSDAGSLHIAVALGIPIVGLFVNSSDYRAYPASHKVIFLNSFGPCFKYNYRWRFFCNSCFETHYSKYSCFIKAIPNKLDLIPIEKVKEAVCELLSNAEKYIC